MLPETETSKTANAEIVGSEAAEGGLAPSFSRKARQTVQLILVAKALRLGEAVHHRTATDHLRLADLMDVAPDETVWDEEVGVDIEQPAVSCLLGQPVAYRSSAYVVRFPHQATMVEGQDLFILAHDRLVRTAVVSHHDLIA